MRLQKVIGFSVIFLFLTIFFIISCSSSDSDDYLSLLASSDAELSSYAEDVRDITPYLGTSANLALWDDGWSPDVQYSVFDKIFDPENGAECIFNPIDSLDDYIEMINDFSSNWDTDVDDFGVSVGENEITVTIENDVTSVTVPFFDNTVSVDRVITVVSAAEGYTVNVAFTLGDDTEALVVHYNLNDGEEIGAYYGSRNSDTGIIEIWNACYVPDDEDPFYGSFKWKGNPDEDWFAITQFTNATDSDWSVMGGGSVSGDMAFIGKNGDTVGEYYIVVDIDDIEGDGVHADPTTITASATTAPDPDTTAVHAYITAGNDSCLGYLTTYPDEATDISWDN